MRIKLLGSGKYLPKRTILSSELDQALDLPEGTIEAKTGVHERHHSDGETLADMAAEAAKSALQDAGIKAEELSVIVSAGASPMQIIPCNAVFFQKALGLGKSGITCFDIDATCMSFLVALDLVGASIALGRYKYALIICSEMASMGLDWKDIESAGLFGDGAVAFVVGAAGEGDTSSIISHKMETYGEGHDLCQIVGGGSILPGYKFVEANKDQYLFQMNGRQLYKAAALHMPVFMKRVLEENKLALGDLDFVIPHQASLAAMTLIRRRLDVAPDRWVQIIEDHGNCIAASIPMALHEIVHGGRAKRGDLLMLFGTGAGFSLGITILRY